MSLKVGSVTPVHKNGDSLDCNNYRPILITSNLHKLMEKLVLQLPGETEIFV